MGNWFKVLLAALIGLSASQFRAILANGNKSTPGPYFMDLFIAWMEKPPYTTLPTNESIANELNGMIRDAMYKSIWDCGYRFQVGYQQADNEFAMIKLMREKQVHIAIPIFEPINRKNSEFVFFKLADYPGTDFITTEENTNKLDTVLYAVLKSWPIFALTLILTAIAGVILWALDTYWNSEEFPRSFIRGSWDGFWWSFISMTTVGYGDKSPKSIFARIFSIIWILFGLIIMAIFMANITSALTALSLQLEPSSFVGVKVAVLGNGTEYQHALEEEAHPKVYHKIEDVITAVKSKEVDGMFLDHYTASYYQARGKLKSLVTVKNLELQRDIGVLFSKNREFLAKCLLDFHSSAIWRSVQTIASTYKLKHQSHARIVNLFDESSPFIKNFAYISLGVLAGMLLIGILWDILIRKKRKAKQYTVEAALNEGATARRQTIQNDLEAARKHLLQMQEHFNKLEAKVSEFSFNNFQVA